jgi:lipid-A-disaccharide synthase
VPTVATVSATVAQVVRSWHGSPIVVSRPEAKYDAFAASRAALAASGSVTLELALAKLPMVTAYRLNPITEKFLKRALKVRQVNLVNLLLGKPLVAELLGPNCTPERLAAALAELITDERVRAGHRQGYVEAMRRLEAGGVSPSLRAADQILEIVAARRCGGSALAPL